MAKRKAKRNAGRSKPRGDFKICREPVVHLSAHRSLLDAANSGSLARMLAQPFLFAIVRDVDTIFASWNIDWQHVFQKATPTDRQVHLRVIGDDGVERKRVAVEPMAAVHYVTVSGLPDCSRVEIGYFQPIDTWHTVAMSNKIEIPPQRSAEVADMDLATIPFHLSFQQLVDSFGPANDASLARVVSEFQKRVLSSRRPNELSRTDAQILRKLNLSLPGIAAAQHDFQKGDSDKLTRRARALLRFAATSPSHRFEDNSGS